MELNRGGVKGTNESSGCAKDLTSLTDLIPVQFNSNSIVVPLFIPLPLSHSNPRTTTLLLVLWETSAQALSQSASTLRPAFTCPLHPLHKPQNHTHSFPLETEPEIVRNSGSYYYHVFQSNQTQRSLLQQPMQIDRTYLQKHLTIKLDIY